MTFDGWSILEFPPSRGSLLQAPKACIYVFCWGASEVPFYAGESGDFRRRIEDDYRLTRRDGVPLKKLEAPTDFCVAEAAEYFRDVKGEHVKVKYKQSSERKRERKIEEAQLIDDLVLEGCVLLNCLRRFNPKGTDQEEQRAKIKNFCEAVWTRKQARGDYS